MAEVQKIEQLLRLERYYRDSQQWSEWRDCYHPDSAKTFIDISWYKGQIDEWVEKSRNLKAAGVTTLHTLSPIDVKIKDQKAYTVSACHIVARFSYNDAEYDLVALLRLVSRLELVEGQGWKILSLEGIYLQDSIVPVLPNPTKSDGKALFDLSSIKDVRPSYQCLIWNIERKGMPARRDLPGIDDPASVHSIMDHCKEWLEIASL